MYFGTQVAVLNQPLMHDLVKLILLKQFSEVSYTAYLQLYSRFTWLRLLHKSISSCRRPWGSWLSDEYALTESVVLREYVHAWFQLCCKNDLSYNVLLNWWKFWTLIDHCKKKVEKWKTWDGMRWFERDWTAVLLSRSDEQAEWWAGWLFALVRADPSTAAAGYWQAVPCSPSCTWVHSFSQSVRPGMYTVHTAIDAAWPSFSCCLAILLPRLLSSGNRLPIRIDHLLRCWCASSVSLSVCPISGSNSGNLTWAIWVLLALRVIPIKGLLVIPIKGLRTSYSYQLGVVSLHVDYCL